MLFSNIFSQRLRYLRKRNNITQLQLANSIGSTEGIVSRLETNSRGVSLDTLALLAMHFNVSIDFLVGLSDTPHSIDRSDVQDLSIDQLHLLDKTKNMPPEKLKTLIKIIDALEQ